MRPISLLVTLVLSVPPAAAQDEPRKVAFLVGVGSYQFNYPELGTPPVRDVTRLAEELKAGGFEATVLTNKEATKAAIEKRFLALLSGPRAVRKGDVLLVALCGHGEQLEVENPATGRKDDEPFFCPTDAKPGDAGTLVGLNWMIGKSEANGPTTLFLVDACRTITDPNRTRSGIQGKQVKLPPKTAILFSCGRGEVSNQSDALEHGLFTYAVIQSICGKTGLRGEVSWTELVNSVEKTFNSADFKKHLPAGKTQTPVEAKGELSYTALLAVTSAPPPGSAPPPPAAAIAKATTGGAPKFVRGQDVKVRTGGVVDFDEKTPRVGFEMYADPTTGALLAVSDTGSIAATTPDAVVPGKAVTWAAGFDIRARKAGVTDFDGAKRFGFELYRDGTSDRVLVVGESGSLAFSQTRARAAGKDPKWHHAMEPKVRAPEQATFTGAKPLGVEAYKDETTGGLVYLTETGAIATAAAPAAAPNPNNVAAPKSLYGLALRARRSDETDFTDQTKKIGVEVFEDPNAGVMLYVSGTGHVATAPLVNLRDKTGVEWKAAMNLKARKAGENDFDAAKKFGIEVYLDFRTGYHVYVCETGSIAVVAK